METEEVDAMGPGGGRGMSNSKEQPAQTFCAAPYALPASAWGGDFSAAAGLAPAAAKPKTQFKRPAAHEPKGAAHDAPKVLYTSRQEGTPFGLAGVPGEQWAGGK